MLGGLELRDLCMDAAWEPNGESSGTPIVRPDTLTTRRDTADPSNSPGAVAVFCRSRPLPPARGVGNKRKRNTYEQDQCRIGQLVPYPIRALLARNRGQSGLSRPPRA